MSILSNNIKFLRKEKRYTQETFAAALGIKRSLIGSYEENRAEPNLQTLRNIAQLLDTSVDALIAVDLSQEVNRNGTKVDVQGKNLRVLTVAVNADNEENIVLIPQKASAGYLNGYADTEFISEMPHFHLPIFTQGSFRAFEIKGDSMLPIVSGTIIIGQFVENWEHIKDNKTYIFITTSDGIVYKRVQNNIVQNNTLKLISDNKYYDAYDIDIKEVVEIWESKAYISTNFPAPELSIQSLSNIVIDLKNQINDLRSGS